jgi:small subunit ribosomal protein S6
VTAFTTVSKKIVKCEEERKMNDYEIMYIIRPEQEIAEDIILKVNNFISSNGGIVVKTDRWGERRMPYDIQDFESGIYVLVTFHANKECVLALHKAMESTEEVLRHMIIRQGVY